MYTAAVMMAAGTQLSWHRNAQRCTARLDAVNHHRNCHLRNHPYNTHVTCVVSAGFGTALTQPKTLDQPHMRERREKLCNTATSFLQVLNHLVGYMCCMPRPQSSKSRSQTLCWRLLQVLGCLALNSKRTPSAATTPHVRKCKLCIHVVTHIHNMICTNKCTKDCSVHQASKQTISICDCYVKASEAYTVCMQQSTCTCNRAAKTSANAYRSHLVLPEGALKCLKGRFPLE